jgi:hypothetical protein
MDRDPDPKRPGFRPRFVGQCGLRLNRRCDRLVGALEGDAERISHCLKHVAGVCFENIAQKLVVASKGQAHRLRHTLPKPGAPFDVGEKKSDQPSPLTFSSMG